MSDDNVEVVVFEIYYRDLTAEAQERLCELFRTTPELENWDDFPLVEVPRLIGGEMDE